MAREVFSDKEIGALLRRATELQEADPTARGAGLSIADIEQIARDTGIDPIYVRAALAERAAVSPTEGNFHILGAPIFVESERIINGKLTEEAWATIVSEASRTFREGGKIAEAGATRAWRSGERRTTKMNVLASPIRGKTQVRATQSFGMTAFLSFYIPTIVTLMVTGIAVSKTGGGGGMWAVAAVMLLTIWSVIRMGFGRHVRKREGMQQAMLDRIERAIAEDETQVQTAVRSVAEADMGPSEAISMADPESTGRIPLSASETGEAESSRAARGRASRAGTK